MKFARVSSPYLPPWLMRFPVAKMSKAQWDTHRNMDTTMEISVAHGQPPLLYSKSYYEPQQQHSCTLRWLAFSRIANTHQPVASKLSYKHDIL